MPAKVKPRKPESATSGGNQKAAFHANAKKESKSIENPQSIPQSEDLGTQEMWEIDGNSMK